jgi:glutamine amidotransferase
MRVAIVDYQSGNLHSAHKAFERAARDAGVTAEIEVTSRAEDVRSADRIVLPGVGAFGDCRAGLLQTPGMVDALTDAVLGAGRPFLGICVGMQLMADRGLEHGAFPGLGWIAGEVDKISAGDTGLKVPHMGWNSLRFARSHPLFEGVPEGEGGWHAYFVHSYHFTAVGSDALVAETEYGGRITAAISRDNMFGTQFHPEKSQKLGLRLIANFLTWRP